MYWTYIWNLRFSSNSYDDTSIFHSRLLIIISHISVIFLIDSHLDAPRKAEIFVNVNLHMQLLKWWK